ncbi:hypothetical protein DL93DRAFT_2137978 [Clavulina sp. PMI_390]|nr:hypothetical protein DL93DRAFT_2137978 [Clavulina sp. PMI_390]
MHLPPDLVVSINRILDDQDDQEDQLNALDGGFDPISTLNTLLPDEKALEQLEAVQNKLNEDKAKIQEELDLLMTELKADQAPERMQIIQELISELLSQLNRIREKASESEAVVREITKDIQALDLAKKNILQSVTTLRRFQMLANVVGQLERQLPSRKYAEISQTVSAMREVAAVFKQYTAIERVNTVWRRVQELQGSLRTMLDEDFDAFFLHDNSKEIDTASLSDACLVVDVLGPDVRNHIVDRYCAIELREYRRIFRANDEAGQLDNISRRFAWFRRIMNSHDEERAAVFPPAWKVGEHLFARFSEITRDDMVVALNKAGSSLTVALLLEGLRQTLDFEQSMVTKFGMPISALVQLSVLRGESKPISSAFDDHMGIFVDAQDKALSDMISAYRGPKARTSLDDASNREDGGAMPPVLPSSTELFYFYGQNLDQCAKFSHKKPLFELSNVHRKWLRLYAEDILIAGLKRPTDRERRSFDGRSNAADIRTACLILNTAEYCQTTASELEDKVREKIADEFKEQVSFLTERDLFLSVISSAIVTLLRELENSCDPHFTTLTRTLWAAVKNVSAQSAYMNDLLPAIGQVVDPARDLVEKKKYLRNFYDKASSLLLARFTNAIVKSRPIKEAGAQQLLLDLQALKGALLKLPGPQVESGFTSYTRNITSTTGNLEKLLKILDVPVDPQDEFIQNYTLLIGDMSYTNFQKVLDLKGTPRVEQGILIDNFVTFTSTREHLEATSFLTSIDMDPPAQVQPMAPAASSSAAVAEARSIFSGLTSPPPESSGTSTPTLGLGSSTSERREVFSDLKRLVGLAVRRDREQR